MTLTPEKLDELERLHADYQCKKAASPSADIIEPPLAMAYVRLITEALWIMPDLIAAARRAVERETRQTTHSAECWRWHLDCAARRVEEMGTALGQIARMAIFPDDRINRTTLLAAIQVARKAVGGADDAA